MQQRSNSISDQYNWLHHHHYKVNDNKFGLLPIMKAQRYRDLNLNNRFVFKSIVVNKAEKYGKEDVVIPTIPLIAGATKDISLSPIISCVCNICEANLLMPPKGLIKMELVALYQNLLFFLLLVP